MEVTPLILCENLVKIHKAPGGRVEVIALQGLNLEAQSGEFLAIVGRSGSGKTTLLNILGSLDVPTTGKCLVAGNDVTRLTEGQKAHFRRTVVGHLWQNSGMNLIPDLTALENVGLPQMLRRIGYRDRTRRARELLEMVGLSERANQYPHELSGGEQQRVALAVTLANRPQILLADEPTGALDTRTAMQMIDLVRQLQGQSSLTTLVVTHDPLVAGRADRTITIRDGRTSTETVRRVPAQSQVVVPAQDPAGTELAAVDDAGRLQLPEEALTQIPFAGRADLRVVSDHLELWPVTLRSEPQPVLARAGMTGLPAERFQVSIVIDRVGYLQLPAESLEYVALARRARIMVMPDHVEIWPATI